MPNLQRIGTSAFINRDGKVLLLLRSVNKTAFPAHFELPGGKLEFGESAEDALKREVLEETGLNADILKPYSTFSYIFNNTHFVDIQFFCESLNEEIRLSDEHDNFLWVSQDELKNLKISEQMREAIVIGFKNLKL